MEISFINVNVLYNRVTATLVSETLYLLFIKNNKIKINFMPKMHVLRWHILLPFIIMVYNSSEVPPGYLHIQMNKGQRGRL